MMPDRLLHSPESDTRFQYEIIKGLSESVRDLAGSIREMQSTQVGMLERLAKLEANRIGEVVGKVEVAVEAVKDRVDRLEQDKDRRDGAGGAFRMIKEWAPFVGMVASILAAAWLYGRSIGITPAPPPAPPRVEASPDPQGRHTVGGRP